MADNPYARYANPYSGLVPVGAPDPNKPLEIRQKQIGVQKGEAELQQTPYELRKQKAEATKAEIDAKNAKEQYDAQHPKASTSGLYGAEFLGTLSPSDRNMVKALSEGRLAFPQGAALRAPFWQEKLSQVAQFDPTFDATDFNSRAKGRANAISGKLGQSNNALNTAIGHIGTLYSQIDGTASHAFTPANNVENWWDKKVLGQSGVTNYEDTASKLADELEAVYRNGGGAEAGVTRQLRNLDVNASRDQKTGIVNNAMDLLASKMAANLSQYNFGTGGKPTWDMLDPHVRDLLASPQFVNIRDKYFGAPSGGGFTPPPTGPGAGVNPSNGQTGDKPDNQSAALWEAAARQGMPYGAALKAWQDDVKSRGLTITDPPPPSAYRKAADYIARNPNTEYHPFQSVTRTPLEPGEVFTNDAGQSGEGALAGHYSNMALAGIPKLLAGDRGAYFDAVSRQGHPYLSTAGDVAGAVTGSLTTGKVVRAAAPNLGRAGAFLAQSPGRTALAGDLSYFGGTGAAENPEHPVKGAVIGAGTALAGNAVGRYVLAPGIAAAAETAPVQGAINFVRRAKGMFGGGDFTPFQPPARLDAGQGLLLKSGNESIDNIRTNLQDAQSAGLPYALADADPKLRLLAGSAARKSPNVRALAEGVLAPRQLGQGERAIGQINSNLAPVGDVPTLQANILKTAQAQSRPLYEAAKSQAPPEITANPQLKEILDRPAAQSAVRKGYETALNNGEDVGTLTYATDPNGNSIQYGNPSWNVLHHARRALDDAGETSVRHALDQQISTLNPGFKAADAKYSGIVKQSDALQSGADATGIRVTPEAAQASFQAAHPNSGNFQQGYASNLADMIERQRLSGNPYDLVNGSMGQQAKLGAVFPEGAPKFMRAQGLEGDMSKTAYETLGGSPTAGRTESDKLFDNPAADAAIDLGLHMATGAPPTRLLFRGIQKMGDFSRLGRGTAKADALGPLLLNTDPSANLRTVDDLIKLNLARQDYLAKIRAKSGQVGAGMFGAPVIYGLSQN